MLATLAKGFFLGISLIIAIGVQNTFVLRMGLAKRHTASIALLCGLLDALMIAAGQMGLGSLIQGIPHLKSILSYSGGAILIIYGIMALRRVWKPAKLETSQSRPPLLRRQIFLTLFALTLLNPHASLDNVLLLGSIGASLQESSRWLFGIGACLASFVWFLALAYGARLLSAWFRKVRTWQILDGSTAVMMFLIAFVSLRNG